jgi:hypothetical protein
MLEQAKEVTKNELIINRFIPAFEQSRIHTECSQVQGAIHRSPNSTIGFGSISRRARHPLQTREKIQQTKRSATILARVFVIGHFCLLTCSSSFLRVNKTVQTKRLFPSHQIQQTD